MLPFARKPDPGRVSKQVSRELPQAWLFGLVRLAPQAEKRRRPSDKRRRPSQFSAPQAEKYAACCDLPALFARFSLALLSQSSTSLPPLVVHKGPQDEWAYCRSVSLCCFSFFYAGDDQRGRFAPSPRPEEGGNCPAARRSPFGGGAGRRPPYPNGALIRKNWPSRSAAGGSWGL